MLITNPMFINRYYEYLLLFTVKSKQISQIQNVLITVYFRMSAMTSFIPKLTPTKHLVPVPPTVRREFGIQTFSTLNPTEHNVYTTSSTLKPLRRGSIAIFFKKIYFLAHTRLRDLCAKLNYEIKVVQVCCLFVCLLFVKMYLLFLFLLSLFTVGTYRL